MSGSAPSTRTIVSGRFDHGLSTRSRSSVSAIKSAATPGRRMKLATANDFGSRSVKSKLCGLSRSAPTNNPTTVAQSRARPRRGRTPRTTKYTAPVTPPRPAVTVSKKSVAVVNVPISKPSSVVMPSTVSSEVRRSTNIASLPPIPPTITPAIAPAPVAASRRQATARTSCEIAAVTASSPAGEDGEATGTRLRPSASHRCTRRAKHPLAPSRHGPPARSRSTPSPARSSEADYPH
jgi:hypothetical protein